MIARLVGVAISVLVPLNPFPLSPSDHNEGSGPSLIQDILPSSVSHYSAYRMFSQHLALNSSQTLGACLGPWCGELWPLLLFGFQSWRLCLRFVYSLCWPSLRVLFYVFLRLRERFQFPLNARASCSSVTQSQTNSQCPLGHLLKHFLATWNPLCLFPAAHVWYVMPTLSLEHFLF